MADHNSRTSAPLKLGRVQLRIMRVLWKQKEATAREITDELCQAETIAHSTVQTLLRQLEDKGMVAHETVDRVFLFRPLVGEPEVVDHAAHDLVSRMFDGSVTGLVAHLLRRERISPEELQRLRKMIEAYHPENAEMSDEPEESDGAS